METVQLTRPSRAHSMLILKVKVQIELTPVNAHLMTMAVLEEALRELLCDGIPHVSTPITTASRQAAEGLLEWISIESNRDLTETLTSDVIQTLNGVFPKQRLSQAARE